MPLTRTFLCSAVLALCASAQSADLKPETVRAFDQYIRGVERRIAEQIGNPKAFLWADQDSARLQRVRGGQAITDPWQNQAQRPVPEGIIHDWIGAVFIKDATLKQTLALVQDYNHHKDYYKPEVIDSKLLSRSGEDFKIYLRLLKKKVITVVLDTDHDVRYFPIDDSRWHSRSYSTKIAEVENAGRPDEREKPPGHDHGFLWRLYSYWRFAERDGGVYVECEAVSLTRDVPTGLGWLINPIIRNLPRESLDRTLNGTRTAVLARTAVR